MATTEVFMSNRQYTDEFKAEAVKQVTERESSPKSAVNFLRFDQ